jgi:uncharacterized repeat protein (TIGR04076 family)
MTWTAHIDGGSRGNPGPAGAGVSVTDENRHKVIEAGFFLGRRTNNQAEYAALLKALDLLSAARAGTIHILTDSELMAHQINGIYRVKSADLKPLFDQARAMLARFEHWAVQHIPREHNGEADRLANQAMDARRTVVSTDRLNLIATEPAPARPPAAREHDRPSGSPPAVSPPRRGVEVRVARSPRKGVCRAAMREGQAFVFTGVTPAGLCLDACSAVMEAVLAIRDAVADGVACDSTMTCRCTQPDCGAVFEIRHLG